MSKFTTRDRRIRMRVLNDGFTMIEVMIVVAIVAVLAAIAIPNYSDYIKRSKITEATTALADLRVRYEQYFLDNRTYVGGCTGPGNIKAIVQGTIKSFTITCPGEGIATYSGVATGDPAQGMSNLFIYTIDEKNAKTSKGPPGWAGNGICWAIRKDGSCG